MSFADSNSRRKYPRRAFKRAISFLLDGQYAISEGVEIGEGGLSFTSRKSLPLQKLLVINFQIPGGSFISVRAKVKNARKNTANTFHIGCSFENIQFESKRKIRTYVSTRSQNEQIFN